MEEEEEVEVEEKEEIEKEVEVEEKEEEEEEGGGRKGSWLDETVQLAWFINGSQELILFALFHVILEPCSCCNGMFKVGHSKVTRSSWQSSS